MWSYELNSTQDSQQNTLLVQQTEGLLQLGFYCHAGKQSGMKAGMVLEKGLDLHLDLQRAGKVYTLIVASASETSKPTHCDIQSHTHSSKTTHLPRGTIPYVPMGGHFIKTTTGSTLVTLERLVYKPWSFHLMQRIKVCSLMVAYKTGAFLLLPSAHDLWLLRFCWLRILQASLALSSDCLLAPPVQFRSNSSLLLWAGQFSLCSACLLWIL